MTDPLCTVCVSSVLLSVISMAEQDIPVEEIATATGLEASAIERHLAECCTLAASTSEPDSIEASDRRLRDLSNRIGLAASVSGIQGDTRSHLSALSLALRVELEQRAAILDRAAAERAAPRNEDELLKVTVAGCDLMLKRALASPPRPGSAIFD